MGADITFKKGNEQFYFRDVYNETNLAWVIGESYWRAEKVDKKGNSSYINFFNKLANITDKQIQDRVKYLFIKYQMADGETEKGWIRMFQKKRDDIKKHLDIINNATDIIWSV